MVASQRNTPITFEQDGDDIQVIDFFSDNGEPNSTDAQNKAESLASALKDSPESFVTIHRLLGAGNMPEQYCTRFPADKFDIGQLQQLLATEYGAGDYRIRIYIKGKVRGNKLLSIAGKIVEDKSVQLNPTGEASNILNVVLARMETQNRQMMEMMATISKPPQSRVEMLNEMLMYKQLFSSGGNSGGIGQITETVELLKGLGMSIGKDEKEEESGFGKFFEMMAPVITQSLSTPKQAPVSSPIQPQPKPTQNDAGKNMLKLYIGTLLNAAHKNSDPVTYSEMIFDLAPEATIKEYITDPAAYAKLVKLDPRVDKYKPWFLALAEHVKAQLGLPSEFSHLYAGDESDINGDTEDTDDISTDESANL